MPKHEITSMPTLRTVGWIGASTLHVTCGTVRTFLSLSSGELHWQFPDSSTEDKFLSVLKNIVSDTRGTELLLKEIPQGFLQGFYLSTSSEIQN